MTKTKNNLAEIPTSFSLLGVLAGGKSVLAAASPEVIPLRRESIISSGSVEMHRASACHRTGAFLTKRDHNDAPD